MNKIRIYLAGTIYDDEPGKSWKKDFTKKFEDVEYKYEFFDPDPINEPEPYFVARDKAEIQKCDILVAYIERVTVGTTMEIFYAHSLGTKPVMIINPTGKLYTDLWMNEHIHYLTGTISDCVNHILKMKF